MTQSGPHEPDAESDSHELLRAPVVHLDPGDLALKQALRAQLFGERSDPIRIGRFIVLRLLGSGGMGVVYAAYDEQLERKVAIKLLHGTGGSPADERRLRREAQALARLSHPNVVGVHDVGVHEDRIYLAMEFVEGRTATAWQRERPRSASEVLEIYVQAGRGLAAAHAAGLVHRDFKPDNVSVGSDGRVRVLDFGLACLAEAEDAQGRSTEPIDLGDLGDLVDPLDLERQGAPSLMTTTRGIAGTPAYMAPEVLAGQRPHARSDQFGFCVALWEALYGERPFGGASLAELVACIRAGRLRAPPRRRSVPPWLRRACERGLSFEPAKRWPSMDVLLATLVKGRRRARLRRGLAAVAGLGLLAAGVEGSRRYDLVRRAAACEASGDEISSAWDVERSRALHEGLVATGVSHAAITADKVTARLEQHAAQWREARVEACLDTEVRGRWDREQLDQSLWCLDERRAELGSLVDELTAANAEVVHEAVGAAADLESAAPCRDERVLSTLRMPQEEHRDALGAVRADVALAASLERAGRYERGVEVARAALERAEALEWQPLTAAARLQLGLLLDRKGAWAEAEISLEDAYFEATDGVAPRVALSAATRLVAVVGLRSARHAEGRRWARHGEIALAQLGDEPLAEARLLENVAGVRWAMGDYDEAKALARRSLVLREEVLDPEHPNVATSLSNLAVVYNRTGDYDEAKRLHQRALAIREHALGPLHPDVATSLNGLAAVSRSLGEYDQAKALHRRALAIREEALGPLHPDVAMSLDNLANAEQDAGALDEAAALRKRALAIREQVLGPEHPDVANSLDNLGVLQHAIGASDEARLLYERALAIREQALGPEHPDVATSLHNLAQLRAEAGALDEAKLLYERTLAIRERTLGPEHRLVARTLVGLAQIALTQQRTTEALPLAERAVAVAQMHPDTDDVLTKARFVLAQALWDAPPDGGRDRDRAVSLAEQCRVTLGGAGRGRAQPLAEVERWLAEHAGSP